MSVLTLKWTMYLLMTDEFMLIFHSQLQKSSFKSRVIQSSFINRILFKLKTTHILLRIHHLYSLLTSHDDFDRAVLTILAVCRMPVTYEFT